MRHIAIALMLIIGMAGSAGPVLAAEPLAAPSGHVILTLTGAVEHRNNPQGAAFDLAMLDRLPSRTATMKTPWTKGEVTFSGPLASAVLAAAGAHGSVLHVVALNDYDVSIPFSDFTRLPVMLATRQNGKPMSVREKGPIFVIYPFDTHPELYNEKYFSLSVWQVKTIYVK